MASRYWPSRMGCTIGHAPLASGVSSRARNTSSLVAELVGVKLQVVVIGPAGVCVRIVIDFERLVLQHLLQDGIPPVDAVVGGADAGTSVRILLVDGARSGLPAQTQPRVGDVFPGERRLGVQIHRQARPRKFRVDAPGRSSLLGAPALAQVLDEPDDRARIVVHLAMGNHPEPAGSPGPPTGPLPR